MGDPDRVCESSGGLTPVPAIAHLGDPIDHGGNIITASPDVYAQDIAVARVGDKAMCAEHGLVTIVTGAARTYANDMLVAFNGSVCSCGAIVMSGGNVFVED